MNRLGRKLLMTGLITGLITLGWSRTASPADVEPLLTVIQAAGATLIEASVYVWAALPATAVPAATAAESAPGYIIALAGAGEERPVIRPGRVVNRSSGNRQISRWEAETADGEIKAAIIQDGRSAGRETAPINLALYWEGKKDVTPAVVACWRQKMTEEIEKNGQVVSINTCLVGRLDDKLREEERTNCLQRCLVSLDAVTVASFNCSNVTSCTAYSPLLGGGVVREGQNINLHIVVRYSPYDGCTYVIAGYPVITKDY